MGNVASCVPSIIYTAAVKVVSPDGRSRFYTRPVKAAELMVDNPRSFLCDSSDLKVGHRIPGLSSDEPLQPRRTYFLLPMEMLFSVLTVEEMSFLNDKASKASKPGSIMNLSKIFPVLVDFNCLVPTSESNKRSMRCRGKDKNNELIDGCSRQRSWRPALETILEIPMPPHE